MPMLMLIDCSSVLVTSSAFRLGYRYQQSEWKNYHFPVFGIVRIRAANGRAGDPINCRSRAIRGLKSYDWLRCVRASQTEYSISRVEWLLNDSSDLFHRPVESKVVGGCSNLRNQHEFVDGQGIGANVGCEASI